MARFRVLLGAGLAALAAPAAWAQADRPVIPRDLLQAALTKAECDIPAEEAVSGAEPAPLGGGLVLVEAHCWRAAYNFASIFFAFEPTDPAASRLLAFDAYTDTKTFKPAYAIVDAQFDPKTRIMSSFFKGRGVGDCGDIGQWVWTGQAFKLKAYWSKPSCDGEPFEADGSAGTDPTWRVFPPRR